MWTGGPFDLLRHASRERDVPALLLFRFVFFVLLSVFLHFVSERHTLGTSPGEDPPGLLHTRWMGAGLGLDAMMNRQMLLLPVIEPSFLGCAVHSGQYVTYSIGDTRGYEYSRRS